MEKKKLISVVKPLIAAALLFGSSGGVAWGRHRWTVRTLLEQVSQDMMAIMGPIP